ncbi:uncharacterized protein LOC141909517 [Tubulanus polymorphus]|uniref:uncharacterized protein LOC141909517 n=1 Tax=Tubulanus polymorphus TaxID=672921 RepID=UPI003DA3AAB4
MQSGRSRDQNLSESSDDNVWSHEVRGRSRNAARRLKHSSSETLDDEVFAVEESNPGRPPPQRQLSIEDRLREIENRLSSIETTSKSKTESIPEAELADLCELIRGTGADLNSEQAQEPAGLTGVPSDHSYDSGHQTTKLKSRPTIATSGDLSRIDLSNSSVINSIDNPNDNQLTDRQHVDDTIDHYSATLPAYSQDCIHRTDYQARSVATVSNGSNGFEFNGLKLDSNSEHDDCTGQQSQPLGSKFKNINDDNNDNIENEGIVNAECEETSRDSKITDQEILNNLNTATSVSSLDPADKCSNSIGDEQLENDSLAAVDSGEVNTSSESDVVDTSSAEHKLEDTHYTDDSLENSESDDSKKINLDDELIGIETDKKSSDNPVEIITALENPVGDNLTTDSELPPEVDSVVENKVIVENSSLDEPAIVTEEANNSEIGPVDDNDKSSGEKPEVIGIDLESVEESFEVSTDKLSIGNEELKSKSTDDTVIIDESAEVENPEFDEQALKQDSDDLEPPIDGVPVDTVLNIVEKHAETIDKSNNEVAGDINLGVKEPIETIDEGALEKNVIENLSIEGAGEKEEGELEEKVLELREDLQNEGENSEQTGGNLGNDENRVDDLLNEFAQRNLDLGVEKEGFALEEEIDANDRVTTNDNSDELNVFQEDPENEDEFFVVHYTENSKDIPVSDKIKGVKSKIVKPILPKLNKVSATRLNKAKKEETEDSPASVEQEEKGSKVKNYTSGKKKKATLSETFRSSGGGTKDLSKKDPVADRKASSLVGKKIPTIKKPTTITKDKDKDKRAKSLNREAANKELNKPRAKSSNRAEKAAPVTKATPQDASNGNLRVGRSRKKETVAKNQQDKSNNIKTKSVKIMDDLSGVETDILRVQANALEDMFRSQAAEPDKEIITDIKLPSDGPSMDSLDLLDAERAPWEDSTASGRNSLAADGASHSESSSLTGEPVTNQNGRKSSSDDGQPQTTDAARQRSSSIPKPTFKSKLPSPTSKLPAPILNRSPLQSRNQSIDEGTEVNGNGGSDPDRRKSLRDSNSPDATKSPPILKSGFGDLGEIRGYGSAAKQWDNVSIMSTATAGYPRETVKSRMRSEKILSKTMRANEPATDEYLTPMQRKEQLIKDLKSEVKEMHKSNEEKMLEIANFTCYMNARIDEITRDKDTTIGHLETSLSETQKNYESMSNAYKDSLTIMSELEKTVNDLKDEMERREENHQEMYLNMYIKGQETAKFERQDEIEKIAKDDPDTVTRDELLEKLKSTELELEHWRSLKRKEMYEEAELPDTEAAATLRFMKDSMFHYLTDSKDLERECHLRAMVNIFKYSTVQMRSVEKALKEKKKKGKT